MPLQTSWFAGTLSPLGRPPAPPKLSLVVLGSMFCSSFEYITSMPTSRFLTGFHTVREPTAQTSKVKLQPMTPPVAKFGAAPAAVRTGPTGLAHMMLFRVLPPPPAVTPLPASHLVNDPNNDVRRLGTQ